jgi:drug/metabolite transporter (DMT)-like permease
MVIIDWARPSGSRPSAMVAVGVLVGLAGVGVLASPAGAGGEGTATGIGAVVLIAGSIAWAAGSIYSRQGAHPESAVMSTGLQMITGSVSLAAMGIVAGELGRFDPGAVTLQSFLGWLYLVTFGSLVGFTAYIYLLRETTPAKATTYAYVNPIVAVLLGWALADEAITARTVVAAGIILASVALISLTAKPTASPDDKPT